MLRAVLFDWTNTLVEFTWDDALLTAGHEAALREIGRTDDPSGFTARYTELVFGAEGTPYDELLRQLLGDVSDDELETFIDIEHEIWRPAHRVLSSAQALLASIRDRNIKTGLVANSWPEPPRLLRRDVADAGLADLLDVIVLSGDVGHAKPDARIFQHGLDALGVDGPEAMYVGDSLEKDVQGAAGVGMATVQAVWFRAEVGGPGRGPDVTAFTPMDVLNAVRRVAR